MKNWALPLASLFALATSVTFAQTQDAGQTGGGAQVAPPTPPAAASTQEKKEPDEKKLPKIWTNDDLSDLKGVISVVGEARPVPEQAASEETGSSKPEKNTHEAMTRHYRDAIAALKAQIANADALIEKLKSSKGEDTSPGGGVDPNRMGFADPPEEQVKELEIKKKQLQAKISDLEEQASKEGIEPGELRKAEVPIQ